MASPARVYGISRFATVWHHESACISFGLIPYTRQLYEADSNNILNSEDGVWKVSFFEVQTRELGEAGYAGLWRKRLTIPPP